MEYWRTLRDAVLGIDKDLSPEEGKELLRQQESFWRPGMAIFGKGIYLGVWAPKDRMGNCLGKTFNLFAAPEDIGLLMTFNEAVAHVGGLKKWHGHSGFDHCARGARVRTPDEALYDALRTGSYSGEWFIPPREILHGKNMYRVKIQSDHLYGNKDKDAFAGTFAVDWYWSCTELRRDSFYVYTARFTDGAVAWELTDGVRLSTRLVRAELRPKR